MKPLEPCLLEISLVVLDAHNSIEATSRVFEIEVKRQINIVNYYSIHQITSVIVCVIYDVQVLN
jgi:hypothetical protein